MKSAQRLGQFLLFTGVLLVAQVPAVLPVQGVHYVRPGDDPQAILDRAVPGSQMVFLPGLHEHPLRKHRSILYVDKAIDIEFMAGATLRLAGNQTVLENMPEMTTDHGAKKTTDDFVAGGAYDLRLGPTVFTIQIDGEGAGGAPDTFSWGAGELFAFQHRKVPVTGSWQTLSNGVQIRFENKSGHSTGSLWFLSYDGRESYGVRVGHGTQPSFIENVRIYGKGTIDLNSQSNVQPGILVKDISAAILVHGRVRNVEIEGVTMTNTMRSVMLYGEHTGKFLQGGGTSGGESFDAENVSIYRTRTINPNGAAYLLGHPSHRGRLSKVRCNFNYMETATTALEPNFNLDQYEVIGNVIKSGGRAIHCWRKSTNGLIKDNVRIDDTSGKEVVMVNAPSAWQNPENLVIRDNRNHLSDPTGYWANVSGGLENRAEGRFATVSGGQRNTAIGLGSTITGGTGNQAMAEYSRVHGMNGKSTRPGEDVLSAGFFAAAGDAQTSQLVAKLVTPDEIPRSFQLAAEARLSIPDNASVSYRIVVAARAEGGLHSAAFEASGMAHRDAEGNLILRGNKVAALHRSSEALDFDVSADGANHALNLKGRGLRNTLVRWVARVELVEVIF